MYLESLHFGVEVVRFDVEAHALLGDLLIGGLLEQKPNLGVREAEAEVDKAALLGEAFFGGAEGSGPERDALVEV